MTGTMHSSIAPTDWLPVQESLLRGLNHALSNRIASLSAISMLMEGAGALDPKLHEAFVGDVEHLGAVLALYRALPSDAAARRDASRFADALERAKPLVTEHPECRDVAIELTTDAATVEPVSLLGRDAFRAGVLMLLGLARAAGGRGRVNVAVDGDDGWVRVTGRAMPGSGTPAALDTKSAELAILARFAATERGTLELAAAGGLVLQLPGLSRSRT